MKRSFIAGLIAAALLAFGGTSTALASNYQVFSETQSFSNNGYGGAGCGAPAYEETGWKVVAGGAELTPTQLSEGDYVTDGFPANLGTEFPAWGINVASVDGHSPGSTKTYAVCIKEPKDGATGPEGPAGPTGPKGETGATGATGATGHIEVGAYTAMTAVSNEAQYTPSTTVPTQVVLFMSFLSKKALEEQECTFYVGSQPIGEAHTDSPAVSAEYDTTATFIVPPSTHWEVDCATASGGTFELHRTYLSL